MRTLLRTFLPLPVLALVLSAPDVARAGDGTRWFADYDKAVETAKEEGKDLFVDFTGSDWCHWCIKLHEEVLSKEAFLEAAEKDYVLVSLDFPNGEEAKAKVPNPERNEELKGKHGIRGFPTVLLMTSDGTVFGQTGYRPGGPESYVEHLAGFREARDDLMKSKEIVAALDGATGDARTALLEDAVATLSRMKPGQPGAGELAPFVREALKAVPDGKTRAMKALFGAGMGDAELAKEARAMDPKNEAGLLECAVEMRFMAVKSPETAKAAVEDLVALEELGLKDEARAFRLYANAAWWSHKGFADKANAVKFARKAKAIGSDQEQILEAMDKILADAG